MPTNSSKINVFNPALAVLFAAYVVVASLALGFQLTQDRATHVDHFGQALSQQLAALSVEPLIKQDLIALGVLLNRTTSAAEVFGTHIQSLDGQIIAASGHLSGQSLYVSQINIDGMNSGLVSVALDVKAFRASLHPIMIAIGLLLPLLLAGLVMGVTRPRREPVITTSQVVSVDLPEPEAGQRSYLLVANLFNQISIAPGEREQILEKCLSLAEQVGHLYGGQAKLLQGTGLVLAFDGDTHMDRCFEVVCATLLLATVFKDVNRDHFAEARPETVFRFGLHEHVGQLNLDSIDDLDTLRDAVLLSATARDQTLVVAEEVFGALDRPERLLFEEQNNPALSALMTTSRRCFLINGIADSYQILIERQSELLIAQEDSTTRSLSDLT